MRYDTIEIVHGPAVFSQDSAGMKGAIHAACKKVDIQVYGGREGTLEDLV